MTRYWAVSVIVLSTLLLAFLAVDALGVDVLADPSPLMSSGGALAAALGGGLLVVDAVFPVASSIVMVAHGAVFGVAMGTLVSLVGSTGAALAGFGLGRRGAPVVVRVVPANQRARAERLLARWGGLAVAATRPVPLLAETVAILAGASAMRWRTMAVASALGALPAALVYALAGAAARRPHAGVLVAGLVIACAATWSWQRRAESPALDQLSTSTPA